MKILLRGDLGMRLYNIYYICKSVYEDINQFTSIIPSNATQKMTSWISYKKALMNLSTIDFIKNDVMSAYNVLNPIDREKTAPEVGAVIYNELVRKNVIILSKISAVIDLYESMKGGTSQPGIDIKIPKCDSLKDYIEILKEIDFIINQCPYLRSENEKIEYKGTDVGSDWITFAILVSGAATTGFVILNNLAAIMNKVISLMSNKKVFDMQEETYKTMLLKNEVTQETINAFEKMKEITYKQYVDELQEELGKVSDGEEEGKVAKSLEKMANLIDKGVEILTSIETPKEIKVLFPYTESQQSLPDGLLKYLEDKATQKKSK